MYMVWYSHATDCAINSFPLPLAWSMVQLSPQGTSPCPQGMSLRTVSLKVKIISSHNIKSSSSVWVQISKTFHQSNNTSLLSPMPLHFSLKMRNTSPVWISKTYVSPKNMSVRKWKNVPDSPKISPINWAHFRLTCFSISDWQHWRFPISDWWHVFHFRLTDDLLIIGTHHRSILRHVFEILTAGTDVLPFFDFAPKTHFQIRSE